jgi:subfamily B ATP-binding cassette protein MsbA
MFVGGVSGATAWLVKPVLDDVFIKRDQTMLLWLPLALILLYVAKGICRYLQTYLMMRTGEMVVLEIRDNLMRSIQHREMSYFDRNDTGSLVSRIVTDVAMMRNGIPDVVRFFRELLTAIGLVVVVFTRDPMMATIALVLFPLAYFPIRRIGKLLKRYAHKSQKEMGGISKVLVESFSGIEVVKAFNWENRTVQKFRDQGLQLLKYSLKRARLTGVTPPILELIGAFGAAAVIWYGGRQVISGETTPGNFFSFMTALFMLYDPIKRIGELNNTISLAVASGERVFGVMDELAAPSESSGEEELTPPIREVRFEDVHFSYDETREVVLRGFSLAAKPGEVVALVGESGAGKSTILKLLPRFYSPDSGTISINGRDIREYEVHSLRAQIAIVTQNTFLFDDTIFSNIAMGRQDATMEQVVAAAKAANAHRFIEALPQGYQTLAGERGDLLSGGQKQRIAIARAILRDSPILILDEATSSLDSESEREIQTALSLLMKGRTTFVIAHRLSTVIHADQILYVKKGVVAERGRHEELMARDGDYARLCKIQFGGGTEP